MFLSSFELLRLPGYQRTRTTVRFDDPICYTLNRTLAEKTGVAAGRHGARHGRNPPDHCANAGDMMERRRQVSVLEA